MFTPCTVVDCGTQLIDNQSYIGQILLHFTAGKNTYLIESQGVR